ncbi:MAG: hypothetical protein ACFFG0_03395 [Candidatus Thorarchaeota archaeon]
MFNIFKCLGGLYVTSVTYSFSAGATIVAAEHNTNNDDLEAAIDAIALTTFSVTASAAEVNFNDGAIAGTVVAGKTVVVDSSKNISEFNNVGFAGILTMGASASISANGESVTDNQIGYLNDVTSDIQAQINTKVASLSDLSITSTDEEIDQVCDGVSANVTAANLTTLTGSGESGGLHRHYAIKDWFDFANSANTKNSVAHSAGFTPSCVLVIAKEGSGGSEYYIIGNMYNQTDGQNAGISWDGTNVYVTLGSQTLSYRDSAGVRQAFSNPYLKFILFR